VANAPVESDERFVGPNPYKMHKVRKAKLYDVQGRGRRGDMYIGKTAVMGMLDRDSREIRTKVVQNPKRETLQNEILKNIEYGSKVYPDAAVGYDNLGKTYVHEVVNQCCRVRERASPHERVGELLEPVQAQSVRNLRVCRTVSS